MTVFSRKQLGLTIAAVVLGSTSIVFARDLPPPPPGPFVSEGSSVSTVRPEVAEVDMQKAQAMKQVEPPAASQATTSAAPMVAPQVMSAPVAPTVETTVSANAAPVATTTTDTVPPAAPSAPEAPNAPVAPIAPVAPSAPTAQAEPTAPQSPLPPVPPPVPVGTDYTVIAVPAQDAQGKSTVEYRAIPQANPAVTQQGN